MLSVLTEHVKSVLTENPEGRTVARPRKTGAGNPAAEAVARKIRAFMAERGIGEQTDMAKRVVLDDGTTMDDARISDLLHLHIKKVERSEFVRPLARAMGCTYEWLVDPDTDWPPPDQVEVGGMTMGRSMVRLVDLVLTLDPDPEKAVRIAWGKIVGVDRPVIRPEVASRRPPPPDRGSREETG
jgi:hypothetical protein